MTTIKNNTFRIAKTVFIKPKMEHNIINIIFIPIFLVIYFICWCANGFKTLSRWDK